jgi:hypothetical protein
LFEQSAPFLSGKNLPIAVGGSVQLDMHNAPISNATHVTDTTVVTAIQRISDPQNTRQRIHHLSVCLIKRGVMFVTLSWFRTTMISGDVGDHVPFGLGKPGELGVLD